MNFIFVLRNALEANAWYLRDCLQSALQELIVMAGFGARDWLLTFAIIACHLYNVRSIMRLAKGIQENKES